MMKKVFMSLLMTLVCLPAMFAQTNAGHTIQIDSITTCQDYVWARDSVTYTTDTVVLFSKEDTTFILNLVRLTSFYDTTNAIVVTGECNASWGEYTWTESGNYFDTLQSVMGCDSIIKIEVSVAASDSLLDEVVCGSYMAPWGMLYTESQTIDTTIVRSNCTYHTVINLTVNPTYSGIDTMVTTGCYYLWDDTVITDLLPHTRTLKTVGALCDSVVTLTVSEYTGEQFDTLRVVACDKYKLTWQSTPVTASGFYTTDSNIVVQGVDCIKHYTVDLTIVNSNNDTASTTPIEIDASCSYLWEGDTITDDENHYHLYTSVVGGCDSLVAIHVNYSGKIYDTTYVEYCGNKYNWKDHNANLPGDKAKYEYTTDTVAIDSVLNATTGCTNYYVLDLKLVENKDTVYQYYCGEVYTHTYQALRPTSSTNPTLTWKSVTTTFTEAGYHSETNDGETLYNYNSSTGCKTQRTLNLNLHTPELRYRPDTVVAEACERYRIKADNVYGIWYTFTFSCDTNVVHNQRSQYYEDQCYDSIVHLSLTINKNVTTTNTVSVCDSYTWVAGGDTLGIFTQSGSYRDTLDAPTDKGCLQIQRLNLTIYQNPIVDIEGKWMLEPGESTVLKAVPTEESDPVIRFRWYLNNEATAASTDTTIELNNVTSNIDVRLESTSNHNCVAKNWITVTSNVGIDDVDGIDVNIYPNPASRFLNIESAGNMSEVVVYNTVGQQVIRTTVGSDKAQLDLGSLASGHYTLRITGVDGNQTTRKFIVNK